MPSHTLRSLRVLIVDDDPLIHTTFAEQLDSQRAITVVAAVSGGRQAISFLIYPLADFGANSRRLRP